MLVNINVSEPKTPEDPDSPLSFSMEGTPDQPPAALIPFFWSPELELHSGREHLSERGWRTIARRRCRRASSSSPRLTNGQAYFSAIPAAFEPREGEWLLVPMYHIFGSDELSLPAPGIRRTRG